MAWRFSRQTCGRSARQNRNSEVDPPWRSQQLCREHEDSLQVSPQRHVGVGSGVGHVSVAFAD